MRAAAVKSGLIPDGGQSKLLFVTESEASQSGLTSQVIKVVVVLNSKMG
jgi:hypothetical protein